MFSFARNVLLLYFFFRKAAVLTTLIGGINGSFVLEHTFLTHRIDYNSALRTRLGLRPAWLGLLLHLRDYRRRLVLRNKSFPLKSQGFTIQPTVGNFMYGLYSYRSLFPFLISEWEGQRIFKQYFRFSRASLKKPIFTLLKTKRPIQLLERKISKRLGLRFRRFLRFFRRQRRTIFKKWFSHFWLWRGYNITHPDYSKYTWILFNSRRKQLKWLRKKKFPVKQRVGYIKRNFIFPRLNTLRDELDYRRVFVLRRISKMSSQTSLLRVLYRLLLKRKNRRRVLKQFSLQSLGTESATRFLSSERFIYYLRSYYCLFMRRKKNNFYLTVTNGLGEVKFFLSSGAYLRRSRERRRNKKARASFRHLNEFLRIVANRLKRKKIFSIRYFMRPSFFRKWQVSSLVYTLTSRSITVENIINLPIKRHSRKKKTKKVRRL